MDHFTDEETGVKRLSNLHKLLAQGHPTDQQDVNVNQPCLIKAHALSLCAYH